MNNSFFKKRFIPSIVVIGIVIIISIFVMRLNTYQPIGIETDENLMSTVISYMITVPIITAITYFWLKYVFNFG